MRNREHARSIIKTYRYVACFVKLGRCELSADDDAHATDCPREYSVIVQKTEASLVIAVSDKTLHNAGCLSSASRAEPSPRRAPDGDDCVPFYF